MAPMVTRVSQDYEDLSRKIYSELARSPQKALKMAERGVAASRKDKSEIGQARMILSRAHAFREMGEYKRAVQNYDLASSIFMKQGEKVEAARTIVGKMDALDQLGLYREALRIGSRAHQVFKRANLPILEARIDANTGNIYHRLGRYRKALRYYELAHRRLAQERPLDGYVMLFNQATIYLCQGNPQPALDLLRSCLVYFQSNQLFSFAGRAMYNLAYAEYLSGKYQDSLIHLLGATEIFRKLRDHSFLASCYLDESELYFRLNRFDDSIDMARRARKKFEKLRMPYELAESNVMLGVVLLREEKVADALPYLKQAQKYFRDSNNTVKSAELDMQIANAFSKMGQTRKARAHLRRSFYVFKRQRMYSRMLSNLTYQAGLFAEVKAWSRAERTLRQAEPWLKKAPLPWVLASFYQLRGIVASKMDGPSAARYLQTAIRLIEGMRTEVPSEDLRISYLQDKMIPYDALIELRLNQRNRAGIWRAFQFSERARSRVLLDLMEGSLSFQPNSEKSSQLYLQLDALRNDSWRVSIGGTTSHPGKREKQIIRIMRRLQYSKNPRAVKQPSLTQIQAALDPDQALISFYWIDSRLNAFVFSREGISSRVSITDSDEAFKSYQLFRFHLERKRHDPRASASLCDPHLKSLYYRLIAPIYPILKNYRTWTIVPHRWLHALPFHCMKSGNNYLVDIHRIQYAPSVSVFLRSKSQNLEIGTEKLLVGYADQNAPLIEEEVSTIRDIYPTARAITGAEATSTQFKRFARESGLIHVASHGRFLPDQPLFSGILLKDGWMALPQIYQLQLKSSLVTLSGCETGGQEILAGDELMGLIRAFLYAGTQSVLVSLWRVFDHSTAFFMKRFYAELAEGNSKLEAWREAMLRTKDQWNHPYDWGPFQLIC